MKRNILAMLMAAIMLASSLTACGGDKTSSETTTAEQNTQTENENTGDDLFAAYRDINLDGRTVKISVSDRVNDMPSSYPYIAGPEELTGESVADSVYNRNLEVEKMLSCKLEYEAVKWGWDQVFPNIEIQVLAGDTAIDYYANQRLGLLHAGLKGYLLDIADKSNFNEYYFDLDSDVYYTDYMDQLAIGDKRFVITGDYFIDTLRASHVLYMNKNIVNNLYGDPDYVYKLVLNDEWTIPKMYEMIAEGYHDTNGNGTKDESDQYGLTGQSHWMAFYSFYYSTECKTISFDNEGIPYFNENNLEMISKITDLFLAINSDNGTWRAPSVPESQKMFTNNQAMFVFFLFVGSMEDDSMRNFEGLGVVPYPKMDESQEMYRTLVHDSAGMGAVPVTTVGKAATAVSAVIQVMSTHAHEYLLENYYEVALKSKYSQDAYSAQMLDIVVAGITAPFEFAYELGFGGDSYFNGITFKPIAQSMSQGANVVASTYASLLPAAQTRLEELIAIYTAD